MMMMVFTMIVLAVCVARLWWVTRKLRNQVATLTAAPPVEAVAESVERPQEVDELRKRVAVLERIATDGNRTLESEIEALRD